MDKNLIAEHNMKILVPIAEEDEDANVTWSCT